MAGLQARLAECHLEMHPTKPKIVYCKDGSSKGSYVNQGFALLGYTFRPRLVKNSRRGSLFWSFTPAVSQAALTAMRKTIRTTNDDECRVRTDHAPANFTTIKHMAHNVLHTAACKHAMRLRRKVAAWDDDLLAGLITR